jgi:hypothetical protein
MAHTKLEKIVLTLNKNKMEFYEAPLSKLALRKMMQFQAVNNLIEKTPVFTTNLPLNETPKSFPLKTFLIIGTVLIVTFIVINEFNKPQKEA